MKGHAVAEQGGNVFWIPAQRVLEIMEGPFVEIQGSQVKFTERDHGLRVLGDESNSFRHRVDGFRIPGLHQQLVPPVKQQLGEPGMSFHVILDLLESARLRFQIEGQWRGLVRVQGLQRIFFGQIRLQVFFREEQPEIGCKQGGLDRQVLISY